MIKVLTTDDKGVVIELTFASRGEASRFIRGKRRVARIVTGEYCVGGHIGGMGMIEPMRPVHNLRR